MRTESTPGARGPVFCGVDTHADSHWLCVLDWRGRKVLSRQFPADAAGYEALAGAIAAAGEPACVAMEGTSSYGAGLTRHLASLGMPVREALSPARTQRRRPGQGKCDESDAERAARAAMSGSKLGTPKSQDGWVDGVRCMLAARSGAVKARTSAINTARSLLTTAPEGLRSRFRGMGGPRLMEELPSVRAEGALGAALGALADLWAAARDAALDMELAIEASLEENCPALLAMYGCGPVSAAKLAVAAGDNPGRLRSEASFAAICGALPHPRLERQDREAQAQQGRRPAGEQRAARDREAEGHARPRDRRVRREGQGAGKERQGGHEVPQALRGQGGVPGADAPARDQEARGRLGARGGQARGEGQPGEGGVHTGHQREVHLDAGEGPKGAQAHKEGLRGMGRGRTSARLGQAGLRGRAQNGF